MLFRSVQLLTLKNWIVALVGWAAVFLLTGWMTDEKCDLAGRPGCGIIGADWQSTPMPRQP